MKINKPYSIELSPHERVSALAAMASEDAVSLNDSENALWFTARANGEVVGCACLDLLRGGTTARFRGDYVKPKYRHLGIYRRLFARRLKLAQALSDISRVTAFSTPMSLSTYLQNGFIPSKTKQIKHGGGMQIVFVEKVFQ